MRAFWIVILPPPSSLTPVAIAAESVMAPGCGLSAPPLNTYPQLFFPAKSDSAVVAMHTAMGAGLAAGPLYVAFAAPRGLWLSFPLAGLGACLVLLAGTLRATLPRPTPARAADEPGPWSTGRSRFWRFAAIAFLYAVAEAGYSNWAVLYLREEKGLTDESSEKEPARSGQRADQR